MNQEEDTVNLQIFVPELNVRKFLAVTQNDFIWDVKRKLLATLPQALPQAFNYGLFLPPCDGRAGKFLLEDRTIRDYPFTDCVPYLELKYKKRVYKMLNLDEKQLKAMHTKGQLKKFMDYVQQKNNEKVEKMCSQGLDANFHDAQGETPLTLAAGIPNNRAVIVSLIGGGAHVDFRNSEGQTAMHKAAFLSSFENVKTLIELGASPNYRDPIGLTPLYYNMLTADSNDQVAEILLREAADIGVTDMHGNHEIHQACKNGLTKHVEHLLYFGGQIDAENVNGNSPLHVCAVNNRPECARVLLFRGADHLAVNKQGQTALHVSHIVGNPGVADVVQAHNPKSSVPYRGTPQYSTRRRLSSTITRRRSMSQSSICSQDVYRTPQSVRKGPMSAAPSPSPSRSSRTTITPSEYGTMRRSGMDSMRGGGMIAAGHETNIARILVIPRGVKGFGFILRGAKHVAMPLNFEPTAQVPALQFFEGVDMSGMAVRAGLRPGDYLLEIDGIDVRRCSHDEVVEFIQQAGDTITLKVITVDVADMSRGGTIVHRPPTDTHDAHGVDYYAPNEIRNAYSESRHASVRQRPGSGRRISAAELENLMVRQRVPSVQGSPYQMQYDQESLNGGYSSKKYNSVSDMKRRKGQRNVVASSAGLNRSTFEQAAPTTSTFEYNCSSRSTPQLSRMDSFDSFDDEDEMPAPPPASYISPDLQRDSSMQRSEYSRPFRPTSRPKTPPPPPPMQHQNHQNHQYQQQHPSLPRSASTPQPIQQQQSSIPPPPPPPPPPHCEPTMVHVEFTPPSTSSVPPPPPPLPPISSGAPPPPPPPPPGGLMHVAASAPVLMSNSKGISADALKSVQLKKAEPRETSAASVSNNNNNNNNSTTDFQMDLKNALAKRRSKVAHDVDEDEERESRFEGLSLRETVRENVVERGKGIQNIGIVNKKDSGYTSSRTSLEPSESEEKDHRPHFSLDHSPNVQRVTLISQHLEDNYGQKDNMSVASSSTASSSSTVDLTKPGCFVVPSHVIPPVDYDDDPDSGTGDSDGEIRCSEISFEHKKVDVWSVDDVIGWLSSLHLSEYTPAFRSQRINGRCLRQCDRSRFTQLGVTRIAHRQIIESALRGLLQ
ncbi:Protein shank [Caenorhabditis elegans]|uniref:Isoform a of Protein shank n=1 Tax=Caenorhabditis elegans TaxID=6239 RepID=B7WN72-2|nr:Protein shank [Caenorhabditis elegans]CAA88324.1 Protein shank [Caenorhabditis elegans]|eukprot:NP_001022006.1 Protein shank [Caenorhabditis elegans]